MLVFLNLEITQDLVPALMSLLVSEKDKERNTLVIHPGNYITHAVYSKQTV